MVDHQAAPYRGSGMNVDGKALGNPGLDVKGERFASL